MKSTITARFQTTIPKEVRERLKLSVHDVIDWQIEEGKVVVSPVRRDFLAYRNRIQVGAGDIRDDIEQARTLRGEEGGGSFEGRGFCRKEGGDGRKANAEDGTHA